MPHEGMIDLGSKPSEEKAMVMKEPSTHYPSIHVRVAEGLEDLPEGEFTFTGKGKVVSYTETMRDGKDTCTCEIEIHGIKPDYAKAKKKKDVGDGLDESLDKIAKRKSEDAEDEESDY